MMGRVVLLLRTVRPISSAKALRVEGAGRLVASLSSSMSMLSTNKVGDIGQPCLTPEGRGRGGWS